VDLIAIKAIKVKKDDLEEIAEKYLYEISIR